MPLDADQREGRTGTLVISLDFELYWGVRDKRSVASYRRNLEGVYEAVPALLELFARHQIHATWATVGFLMLDSFEELLARSPAVRPRYERPELCPYRYAETRPVTDHRLHFAPALVRQVAAAPNQEVATHTLSHFYCLEEPRDITAFEADVAAAASIAVEKVGRAPTSIVFPRNQWSAPHVAAAARLGVTAARGNPTSRLYAARRDDEEHLARRAGRLLDAYLPISGRLSYPPPRAASVVDVAASRFLRPYAPAARHADWLRIRRIRTEMEGAAARGDVYHLWWHPHNFGTHLRENLDILAQILDAFQDLCQRGRMSSLHMGEVAAGTA